jgi:CarD family transcriptional regulator
MSSVKKIAKSPKAKAAQTKAESAKSAATRGRTAKRGAEPSQKNARATASRVTSARPKTKAATKPAAAQKTKAVAKPAQTSAARAGKANVVKARTAKASAAKASTAKANGAKTGQVRTEKAKTVPKVRPTAKAAARKTTRSTTKSAPAQKTAPAKRKTSATRGVQTKQAKATTLAKAKAGVTAAPRMVPAKTGGATESRRSKTASREPARGEAATREQIAAVAKKAATKLAAHPEVRLALRPMAERPAAAQPAKGQAAAKLQASAKTQAVTKTIEGQEHRPVIQKLPKKTVAAPAADSAVLPTTRGGTVQMEAEKLPAERPQIQELMAASNKPQPVIKEVKGAEVKAAEAKNVETKMADKAAPVAKSTKAAAPKQGFKPSEYIVYPAHGVGQIVTIEEQEVAGFKLELYVISFIKDKMILKVPVPKSVSVGMRKLAGPEVVKRALATLTGRARIKRTMWSRRAQEYEAKINSGDLVAIAEVVRDLYRSDAQPEQSYSERQLYEAALDRVAREIAVVQKLTETESLKLIESQLQKGPRRGKGEDADTAAAEGEDGDIDEAA